MSRLGARASVATPSLHDSASRGRTPRPVIPHGGSRVWWNMRARAQGRFAASRDKPGIYDSLLSLLVAFPLWAPFILPGDALGVWQARAGLL
ncbi:hypothetical protein [Dictyobacter formicarum]|uniref:hypothetical protein n=1 Tax=Dictyobacter formicarum TaxID=2778368 RepID=UPI00191513F7|nr:hypothetical protein [Dictyobacter formicarum]